MRSVTRRRVIGATVSALAAGVAGCSGEDHGNASAAKPAVGEGRRATESAATPTGETVSEEPAIADKTTAQPNTTSRDKQNSRSSLRLPSLTTHGSPGGPIAVQPSRVVLLDFFATWCAPCIPEMANLGAVRRAFSHSEVFILSVTQETDQIAVKRFWERHDGTWPVAMDPNLQATRQYGVTVLPTILVFAADGTRIERHRGLVGEKKLMAAVETALDHGSV